jgi:hypothetical protein
MLAKLIKIKIKYWQHDWGGGGGGGLKKRKNFN